MTSASRPHPNPATVFERYLDASSDGDVDRMVALTDPAYEFGTPRSVLRGHDALREAMAVPRGHTTSFEPQRWFVGDSRVVCVARAVFHPRATDEPAGESLRYLWAEVSDGRLRRSRSGFADLEAALADAGLSEADERHEDDPAGDAGR